MGSGARVHTEFACAAGAGRGRRPDRTGRSGYAARSHRAAPRGCSACGSEPDRAAAGRIRSPAPEHRLAARRIRSQPGSVARTHSGSFTRGRKRVPVPAVVRYLAGRASTTFRCSFERRLGQRQCSREGIRVSFRPRRMRRHDLRGSCGDRPCAADSKNRCFWPTSISTQVCCGS